MEETQQPGAPVEAPVETPETPEAEHKRLLYNARMRRHRRKKAKANADLQRRKKNRKMKRYRRNRRAKEKHEKWLARKNSAEQKRQARIARRAQIEARAAEKLAIRAAQGLPKYQTPMEKKVDAAYTRGFQDGVEAGRAMERAEIERGKKT